MITVPGTYFTIEQLEVALKVDKVSARHRTGSNKLSQIGYVCHFEKKQYDKTLAWYILAAMENHSKAQNNIGVLYFDGLGVPKNYLCALNWYLKAIEQSTEINISCCIGKLFEYSQGGPLENYKALE